jgi:hypothetical protein
MPSAGAMRSAPLLLATMMLAGGARAAADCPAEGNVQRQAECLHDQMSPDVIDKLYRLALSTVHGKLDTGHASDFIYIAEEAGEAARRKGPKPLLEMARSHELSKVFFAAHAIKAFINAAHHGYSHRDRYRDDGDAKLYAEAKRVVRAPCKRLAAHEDPNINAEGDGCLREIDQPPMDWYSAAQGPPPDVGNVRKISEGASGLRGTPEGAIHGPVPSPRGPRASKAASKTQGLPPPPAPPPSN